MLRLPLKLSVLVFCLFVGSPQAQACRSHSWAHTIFFNTAEGMVELPPDAELIAEVLLTGSDQDGEATAANIVRVIKTSDAGVHQGEEIPIRVNTTSCGPEPISGRQGIIAAKVRTDIDDQPVLCLYSRPYGDVRIGSPDSHFLTECWPSVTALAKRTRLAAENGEVMAQIALGLMYEKGRYARQDKAKALKWLHLAAESGEAEAQYELGAKYRRDRNDKEAVEWFKLAAAQGHAQAVTEIGPTHEHGGSFKQSDAAAGSAGAVEQGNREAKLALEMEALKRAAEKGEAEAQYELGKKYLDRAYRDDQNAGKAVELFKLAAAQGHVQAMTQLGLRFALGRGVPRDYKEAEKWYRLAAGLGDAEAQFHLGDLYWGLRLNQKALEWYRRAAEHGYAEAQYILGRNYKEGYGVEPSEAEAVKWYRLAAEQGDGASICDLADMYLQGRAGAGDDEEAMRWYRLAAEKGCLSAKYALEALPKPR